MRHTSSIALVEVNNTEGSSYRRMFRVKTSRHQIVARRKRRIERRLRPRTWRAQLKPMYTARDISRSVRFGDERYSMRRPRDTALVKASPAEECKPCMNKSSPVAAGS